MPKLRLPFNFSFQSFEELLHVFQSFFGDFSCFWSVQFVWNLFELRLEFEVRARYAELLGIDVNFVQVDFKRLHDVFDEKFDCVTCVGNSLNHELEEKGILSALRSMYNVLSNRGVVIIEIRNLLKWVKEGRRFFPVHFHKEPNGDRKVFFYVLDFCRTRVKFNVISFLEFNEKPTFEVDSVDYRIVSAQKLRINDGNRI